MLIFEHLDSNKDNNISEKDLIKGSKVFQTWGLDDIKLVEIFRLSSNNELNLSNFIYWMNTLPYYNINDIK